jgi:hypothetical protein
MTQNISLEELVLGYCRQVDGLVEPPAYGAYEVLLPDEVAARWGIVPHQHLSFAPDADPNEPGAGNAAYIHFGHNLVETIVDEVRTKTANGRFFINNVRPEKPKLYEVVEKAFSLPNAKMFPVPNAKETISLHHYARFNFKVSLIADEKRELILPLWMDAQGGFSVKAAEIERMAILDMENQSPDIPPAALLWSNEPPLSPKALAALLERARLSVAFELGDTLDSLQKRLLRFLELDRARLNDYYDDLRKDNERRLSRAEDERRPALEAKLAAIDGERQSKLADVEQKYHLHIQLELINLAIIAQPKLDLTVEIRKRGVTIKRRVTWDPLLHVVEELACDACNRPGQTLFLCENGHLAHGECLAPQCVDCKRTFCQKCAAEVQTCAVCERPVCVHSLNRCKECGRATCQEHVGECHADNGQPRRVSSTPLIPPIFGVQNGGTQGGPGAKTSTADTGKSAKPKAPARRETSKAWTFEKPRPEVAGDYMEVYANPAENVISAVVMVKKREIATREWSMGDKGIAVNCWCEKQNCANRGVVYYPTDADKLAGQITLFIERFAEEYDVPLKKIRFFQVRQGQPFGETKLKVPSGWRDPATLARAQAGFDALTVRNRGRR